MKLSTCRLFEALIPYLVVLIQAPQRCVYYLFQGNGLFKEMQYIMKVWISGHLKLLMDYIWLGLTKGTGLTNRLRNLRKITVAEYRAMQALASPFKGACIPLQPTSHYNLHSTTTLTLVIGITTRARVRNRYYKAGVGHAKINVSFTGQGESPAAAYASTCVACTHTHTPLPVFDNCSIISLSRNYTDTGWLP